MERMHIARIFERDRPAFSFEFFPPRSPDAARLLYDTISSLAALHPSFVSVTYGAGGSTRHLTHELVTRIQSRADLVVVAHLTCVGSSASEIRRILDTYREGGIENVMALRGDPPRGDAGFSPAEGGFAHAGELVGFIHGEFPAMGIGVAGYPEGHPATPNRLREIELLKEKVDAGADYICTQLFFDNRVFFDFCERCELAGIRVPIIAGIMPILSRKNLVAMADKAAGVCYPARLLKALNRASDDTSFENVGIHWATEQVLDLLDHGVRGIHFYTFNRAKAVLRIYNSLGISRERAGKA